MLGRGVAQKIAVDGAGSVIAPEVVAVAHEADLVLLNLECCISTRGTRWPQPGKPFFFRGPPEAVDTLRLLGVDCVTLANNHALDYGFEALADTTDLLGAAGIGCVGAGSDLDRAREPKILEAAGFRLGVLALTDHPGEFAAASDQPGVAYADLRSGVPMWVCDAVRDLRPRTDAVLVTPHWGPNMVAEPVQHVRRAAAVIRDAGATIVAGHSAHVFHGVERGVLFDLGDFLDDYATDPALRNDLGVLWLVEVDPMGLVALRAVPIKLDFCSTRLAGGDDARWIRHRLAAACRSLGTTVRDEDDRLVVEFR